MTSKKDMTFTGERAEFMAKDIEYVSCTFEDGESPLKHSEGIEAQGCEFKWKYPFWYSRNIKVSDCTFHEMGRAGVWYSDNVSFENVKYIAPKGFRRCDGLTLRDVCIPFAQETLWACRNVTLKNVKATGDYLAMNCEDMQIDGLTLDGNYSFDGAKNIKIKNSVLRIVGEYIGWNSKNLTFINCEIESLQGLCFIEGLYMRGCTLRETTLSFEYSTNIDAEILGAIDSVKNPSSGKITAGSIGELIMEEDRVDVSKTQIICTDG